jgi:hypothetical protein
MNRIIRIATTTMAITRPINQGGSPDVEVVDGALRITDVAVEFIDAPVLSVT